MKKISAALVLLLGILFSGCGQTNVESSWLPPVKGLQWGMSLDEVLKALNYKKDYKTRQAEKGEVVVLAGDYTLTWGVEIQEMTLHFVEENMGIEGVKGLSKISGKCRKPDVTTLLAQINAKLSSCKQAAQEHYQRWASKGLADLPDASRLQGRLEKLSRQQEKYAHVYNEILTSPLEQIILADSGDETGFFQMDAGGKLFVDALRRQVDAQSGGDSLQEG